MAAEAICVRGSSAHYHVRTERTHLIPNILRAASRASGPLSVNGTDFPTRDGTAERDYVHVVDIADAHLRALERIDEKACAVYNLRAGRGATFRRC